MGGKTGASRKGDKGSKGGKGGKGGKSSKGKGGKGGKGKKGSKGGKGGHGGEKDQKIGKREREERERDDLNARVEALDEEAEGVATFADMPLSDATLRSLERSGFKEPTEIQQQAIPAALKGRDVMGAAKTGSGKTLSFVVPALELLFRKNWGTDSGLGVIIISPTRELAGQIFETVKIAGHYHHLNGGLIVGGSKIDEEAGIVNMNLVVATPGRLMHHIDTTLGLDTSQVMMLVLDEADNLLELGFQETLQNITSALPPTMQTLLFSATQTKDLHSLSTVPISNPYYISVHSKSRLITPKKLCQNFMVCSMEHKLAYVFSFIKKHVREKTIIFFSTCNQVRYVYLALSRLLKKDGACTMCLTGKMKPNQRKEVYDAFCQKSAATLFCTNVGARGLDFPSVKWVIQADCPENADTYIHRVGRTARAGANGASLLLLLPSEERFLKRLADRKIRLREVQINDKYLQNLSSLLRALNVQDVELKQNSQKAVVSYLRGVYFESDKEVFDVDQIDPLEISTAMGLLKAPTLKFIDVGSKETKNLSWELRNLKSERDKREKEKTRKEKKWSSAHGTKLQDERERLVDRSDDDSDSEGLFTKRAAFAEDVQDAVNAASDNPMLSIRATKKLKRQQLNAPANVTGDHTVFGDSSDDEGRKITPFEMRLQRLKMQNSDGVQLIREEKDGDTDVTGHLEKMKAERREHDLADKEKETERIKTKRKRIKDKMREEQESGKKKYGFTFLHNPRKITNLCLSLLFGLDTFLSFPFVLVLNIPSHFATQITLLFTAGYRHINTHHTHTHYRKKEPAAAAVLEVRSEEEMDSDASGSQEGVDFNQSVDEYGNVDSSDSDSDDAGAGGGGDEDSSSEGEAQSAPPRKKRRKLVCFL